jgi:hypothetical protein
MSSIDITISDATGSKMQPASLPSDAPMQRIVAKLIDLLNLPITAPDGQPMSYKFHHVQSSRQLRDEMTLDQAGVQAGDTLRLVPEIVAG